MSIRNGFERSIHLWIGDDVYKLSKIAAILNFHVNMPPSWIFGVCFDLYKKLVSSFMCITAQYNYVIHSDATYSAEETIY